MEKMSERTVKSHGYKSRTPWLEAIREVPSAWLEDEAKNSSSPYSLLASWKGHRGGVPSHVMIKLIRRRLREYSPEIMQTALPPASLQRAQDILVARGFESSVVKEGTQDFQSRVLQFVSFCVLRFPLS